MKKVAILGIVALLAITPEFSQAASIDTKTSVSVKKELGKGRRKRNGSYKKKKGFMWGLFKGKNQCDCPKH